MNQRFLLNLFAVAFALVAASAASAQQSQPVPVRKGSGPAVAVAPATNVRSDPVIIAGFPVLPLDVRVKTPA
jgi:hypothetical protein